MTNDQSDGRPIEMVWWVGPDGQEEIVRAKDGERLVLHHLFYGDHGENWVMHYRGDNEVARYNARFIAGIRWLQSTL